MKDRLLDFLRSPTAMCVGLILLVAGLFWIVREQRKKTPIEEETPVPRLPLVTDGGNGMKERPVTEVNKHFTPWRPLAILQKKPEIPIERKAVPAEPLPRLIHSFEPVQKAPPIEVPVKSVSPTIPFGSVIPVRLLQPVQCGKGTVPVIAELLQPVRDAKGKDWIPRGTRIHGSIKTGSLPGRLESAGGWIFVLPDRKLLETKASLQDRDFDHVRRLYGTNDGTTGISGTIVQVKTSGWKQTVLRDGVAVAADVAQDRMTTALGVVELGSARNAALRGVSSLVKGVTPVQSETSTESYVTVSAGKEFYLYIDDKGEVQSGDRTGEVETMLRERSQLMEQLRQKIGRGTP